jgi:hypothetical protein
MAAPDVPLLVRNRPFDYSTPRGGYSTVNLRLGGRTGGTIYPLTPPPQPLPFLELDAEDCPPFSRAASAATVGEDDGSEGDIEKENVPPVTTFPLVYTRSTQTTPPTRPPACLRPAKRRRHMYEQEEAVETSREIIVIDDDDDSTPRTPVADDPFFYE